MPTQISLALSPSLSEMEQAFSQKDASYDGVFFVAVRTTGIFCRPSCSSKPKRENVEFFFSIRDAVAAGYRACKRCHPMEVYGALPDWVLTLAQRLETNPSAKLTADDLRSIGVSPERARRWFQEHYGMTFAEWCRGRRMAEALSQIQAGTTLDEVVFDQGYESHSGFREAFSKLFGTPPKQSQNQNYVAVQILETPIGAFLAGAVKEGICLLDYADRSLLQQHYKTLQQQFDCPVLPVMNEAIEALEQQLSLYFAGQLRDFSLTPILYGTPFQQKVWSALQQIPYGQTISYDELARRIEQPTAVRAVARANGMNRISVLVPCHRVIGKDGQLTGYGGGLWRKRLLLQLEQGGSLPQ